MKFTTKNLTIIAMLIALCTLATMVLQVPIPPFGYINLGDTIILLGSFIFGALGLFTGIGAMLADLLLGYGIYAPATLVIKTLMAFVAYKIITSKENPSFMYYLVSALISEIIMLGGYYLYDAFLSHSFAVALGGVLFNAVQGGTNLVIAILVGPKLSSILKNRK